MKAETTLQLNGIRFFAHHGVYDEEQKLGRPLEASIEAHIDEEAQDSDSILDTVNYVELAKLLVDISDDKNYRTLEALGKTFLKQALTEHERINWIALTLKKAAPPTGLIVDEVGIQMVLSRADLQDEN